MSDTGKTTARPSAFDWADIRRRLERTAAAMEHASVPTAARKAEVLKARAQSLARQPREERPEHYIEVVEFMLAYERYAVDSSFVSEVHPLKDLTTLPGAPAFVAGIINVRGRIVSVVNLKRFFDLPDKGLTDFNKVIILDDGRMEFGLLVDAVLAVQRLALDAIQRAPPTLNGVRADYVRGVTTQRMAVLDAAKILADPTIVCAT